MQINNLTKCCKPRHFGSTASDSVSNGKRVRYKHYEEMDNDILRMCCLRKACSIVQSGGKLKLRDSLPAITATIIGTSLALAQPGKLASKAAKGLGFLALVGTIDFASEKLGSLISSITKSNKKKDSNSEKKAALLGIGAGIIGACGIIAGALALPRAGKKLLNANTPFSKFLSAEKEKLTSEINLSKAGKFVEGKINPFVEKHQGVSKFLRIGLPLGAIFGNSIATFGLDKSISHDVKEIATNNFVKAKLIQKQAKEDFDKIDAIEV